jgi:hypothetical protein
MLDQEETRDRHNIVTLDESWVYLGMDHELIWLAPREMVPEKGTAHDSISKIDDKGCVEYKRIPCSRRSAEGCQIQRELRQ